MRPGADPSSLVRLAIDANSGVALLELNDAQRFNTMGSAMNDDFARAVDHLRLCHSMRAVTWQGAGTVFCAGGNPYGSKNIASYGESCQRVLGQAHGFACLRELCVPIACAVHGPMIGGACAIFLHADVLVAESASTFQHGNLSRGVCPIAEYSRTLQAAIGAPAAAEFYLTDQRLTSTEALMLGLVHLVCSGVGCAKARSSEMAHHLAALPSQCKNALIAGRCAVDVRLLQVESVAHMECQLVNGGYTMTTATTTSQTVSFTSPTALVTPRHEHISALHRAGAELLSITRIGRAVQGSLPCGLRAAVHEQLRVATQQDVTAYRRGAQAADSVLIPWRAEMASISAESQVEKQRVACCLLSLASPKHQSMAWRENALLPAVLRFDVKTGVAAVELDGSRVATALEASLRQMLCFGPALRAVVLHVGQSRGLDGSARALEQIDNMLDVLNALGVPVVCSMDGKIDGMSLAALTAADYLIAGQHVVSHAVRGGSISERAVSPRERAAVFAAWLVDHAAIGLTHMLHLTRLWPARGGHSVRPGPVLHGSRSTHKAGCNILLHGTRTRSETSLLLASQSALLTGALATSTRSSPRLAPINRRCSMLDARSSLAAPRSRGSCDSVIAKERAAGVCALEVYTPRHCVNVSTLEEHFGHSHSVTSGLLLDQLAVCSEYEDAASMALTALHRLIRRCIVQPVEIGMLHVGASLLDRSKSLKTELMALAEADGCADVEGTDHCDSSASSTSALLRCVSWVQAGSWDGRWAVALCSDPSSFGALSSSSAGAAAVMVGQGLPCIGSRVFDRSYPCTVSAARMTPLPSKQRVDQHGLSMTVHGRSRDQDDPSRTISAYNAQTDIGRARAMLEQVFGVVLCSAVAVEAVSACSERLLARQEARKLLDAPSFAALCARRATTLDRFGWVTRLDATHTHASDAFCLLRVATPTTDGAAARQYRLGQQCAVECAPSTLRLLHVESRGQPAPAPTSAVHSIGLHAQRVIRHAPTSMMPPSSLTQASTSVSSAVHEVAAELVPSASADVPLMEAGLDSLGSVELRNRLSARLGDAVELPETLIFDHPTLRQIEAHASSLAQPLAEARTPVIAEAASGLDVNMIAQLLGSLQRSAPSAAPAAQPMQYSVDVAATVREVAAELVPSASADVPLMEAGLDSLGSVELRNRLSARLGDAVELPETLIFDHPTLRQIEAHASSLAQPLAEARTPAIAEAASGLDVNMIAQLLGSLQRSAPSAAPAAQPMQYSVDVAATVREVAAELVPSASADVPLMEAGLDSLGSVELRNRLSARLGDAVELPETLIFDHPTLRQIEAGITEAGSLGEVTRIQPCFPQSMADSPDSGALVSPSHERLSASLTRLRPGKSGMPLFASPSFNGRSAFFAALPVACALYALEFEHIHTGGVVADRNMGDVAEALATDAISECGHRNLPRFHLIGASFGAALAHQVALSAQRLGSEPHKLVMIDALPVPPHRRMMEASNRMAAIYIENVFRVGAGLDAEDLEAEYEAVADAELGAVVARRLADARLRPFSFDSVVAAGREIYAFHFVTIIMSTFGRLPLPAQYKQGILAVVASERAEFFFDALGCTAEESLASALDLYGDVETVVHVDGSHMEVCAKCATNQVPQFTRVLQNVLVEADAISAARFEPSDDMRE